MPKQNVFWGTFAVVFIISGAAIFFVGLEPMDRNFMEEARIFKISPGEGFLEISDNLKEAGIIKSKTAFRAFAILSGSAARLKAGVYELSPSENSFKILEELVRGSRNEVVVRIPEGDSVYEIDLMLSEAGIVKKGDFLGAVLAREAEGRLFPDTYKLFTNSSAEEVVDKFLENFNQKTKNLLGEKGEEEARKIIILASLLEKEVPDEAEMRIVGGLLLKRENNGMPLQVDATICYIKKALRYPESAPCYPLTPLDFQIESDYNTYLYKGLPPKPIGNPGISAIRAAMNPESSPYWYYLSDPDTRKTIFSATLDEHNRNRVRYLGL